MGEKEQRLEILQSRISELKKCSQNQETPAKLQVWTKDDCNFIFFNVLHGFTAFHVLFFCHQVLENDLRKKISTVQKLNEQARGNLMDFSYQRKQLEDYISQMSAWLKSMEDSFVSSPTGSDPDDICRVKVPPQ